MQEPISGKLKARYRTVVHPSGATTKIAHDVVDHAIQSEMDINLWTRQHFDELGLKAAIIAAEMDLGTNKKPDILAINSDGRICVIEFKRDEPDRELFAQVLDYSQIISGLLKAELDELCSRAHCPPLAEIYSHYFGRPLPEDRPVEPLITVVASGFFPETLDMARYLNEKHCFELHLVRYVDEAHRNGVKISYTRELTPKDCHVTQHPLPGNAFAIRFEESSDLSWELCVRKNIIPAPEALWQKAREREATVLIDVAHKGYVGVGKLKNHAPGRLGIKPPTGIKLFEVAWDITLPLSSAFHRPRIFRPKEPFESFRDKEAWRLILTTLEYRHRRPQSNPEFGTKRLRLSSPAPPKLPLHEVLPTFHKTASHSESDSHAATQNTGGSKPKARISNDRHARRAKT